MLMDKLFSQIIILKNSSYQKKIILIGTSFFALHALYFIHSFGVNIPITDEWAWVTFAQMVLSGEPFWEFPQFIIYNGHGLIITNLIFLLSIVFSAWNFIYLMYFGWVLVSISVFVTFLIVKKTFPQTLWIMIPISAIMYSPIQYENFLWGFASVQLFMISATVFLSIYFLNKINSNRFFILPAICCGIISSFSGVTGIGIWFLGFYSILLQVRWKKSSLIIWTICSISIFTIFSFLYSNNSTLEGKFTTDILSISGIKYFIFYLSHGIALKFELIRLIVGSIILSSIIGPLIYFAIKRNTNHKFIPWIQLGLAGIFSGGFTLIGRFTDANVQFVSRYSTFTAFDQVAALVIITAITYFIYLKITSKTRKKILKTIYLIMIFCLMVLIISAYYFGYTHGQQWKTMNDKFLGCLLNPIFEFKCVHPNNLNDSNGVYKYAPILYELNLEPFHNKILVPTSIPLLDQKEWKNMEGVLTSNGEIESIRFDLPNELNHDSLNYKFVDKGTLLQIYGWGILENQNKPVESTYIFLDDKVHSKATYGFLRKDLEKYGLEARSFSGWFGIIDPKEISFGCYDVSVRIVNENEYSEIHLDKKLCKNRVISESR